MHALGESVNDRSALASIVAKRCPRCKRGSIFQSYWVIRRVPEPLRSVPDEGYGILQAQNRVVRWQEVLDWLDKYLKH